MILRVLRWFERHWLLWIAVCTAGVILADHVHNDWVRALIGAVLAVIVLTYIAALYNDR